MADLTNFVQGLFGPPAVPFTPINPYNTSEYVADPNAPFPSPLDYMRRLFDPNYKTGFPPNTRDIAPRYMPYEMQRLQGVGSGRPDFVGTNTQSTPQKFDEKYGKDTRALPWEVPLTGPNYPALSSSDAKKSAENYADKWTYGILSGNNPQIPNVILSSQDFTNARNQAKANEGNPLYTFDDVNRAGKTFSDALSNAQNSDPNVVYNTLGTNNPSSFKAAGTPTDGYDPLRGISPAFPDRPGMVGNNTAPSAAPAAPTPAAPTPDAPADAAVGPGSDNTTTAPGAVNTPDASQGGVGDFFNKLIGSASMGDPNAINPNTGLTNAQTQLMASNMFMKLGGTLMAAAQPMFGPQRAQILAKLGEAAPDADAISQMQTRLLQNNALARKNASQANLLKIMQSPEFQKSFDSLSPEMKAIAKAAAASGDDTALNTITGLIEKTQPQFSGNFIVNKQTGIATDTISGQRYDIKTGAPIQAPTAQNNGAVGELDLTKYNIPSNVRVNKDYLNSVSEEYRQRLANIAAGVDTLGGASRGNSAMMQRMQMDVQRAFPDYNPVEAQARAGIVKSLSDHGNGKLGAYSDSVGTMGEHFNTLADDAKNLKNAPLMYWNALKNRFEAQTGDPAQTKFATSANIYLSELAKVLKGGGVPTDSDKAEVAAMFNQNLSNGQLRAGLQTMNQMARARVEAVDSTTQRVMGDYYDPKKHSVVTPYAQKQFDTAASNTWLHPELAKNNVPKPGDIVKGYKFKGGDPANKNNWEQQ